MIFFIENELFFEMIECHEPNGLYNIKTARISTTNASIVED